MTASNTTHRPWVGHTARQLPFHEMVRSAAGRWVASAVVVCGMVAGGQTAHATSLVWSVGVHTPGAVVQVGSHPPPRVVYQPAPVQVVVNPVWGEPPHRSGPPVRWYGPHPGASLGHHHRDFDDRRRGRNHHHGWRDRDGDWEHRR